MSQSQSLHSWASSPTEANPVELDHKLPPSSTTDSHGLDVGTHVLLTSIVGMLRKIEIRMDGQDKRLSRIESNVGAIEAELQGLDQGLPEVLQERSIHQRVEMDSRYSNLIQPSRMKDVLDDRDTYRGTADRGVNPNPESRFPSSTGARDDTRDDAYSISVYSRHRFESTMQLGPEYSEIQPGAAPTISDETATRRDIQVGGEIGASMRSDENNAGVIASSDNATRNRPNLAVVLYSYGNWKRGLIQRMKIVDKAKVKRTMERLPKAQLPQRSKIFSVPAGWLNFKVFRLGRRSDD